MIPHVATQISNQEIELFELIKKDIQSLPDNLDIGKDPDNKPLELTCHMLAEAISKKYNLRRVDGAYIPVFMFHSWCISPEGNIIDVYPCLIVGGPLFIYVPDKTISHQLFEMYKCTQINIYGRWNKYYFDQGVNALNKYLTCK